MEVGCLNVTETKFSHNVYAEISINVLQTRVNENRFICPYHKNQVLLIYSECRTLVFSPL